MQGSHKVAIGIVVLLVLMAGIAIATFTLSGNDEAPKGADSPTAAVEELLAAAADRDLDRAQAVTTGLSNEDLEENLAEIAVFVQSAGGLEAVSAHNDAERQMGSGFVVEVLVSDSTNKVTFDVIQSGGKYRVVVGDEPAPEDEQTADPYPPPPETTSPDKQG